MSRYSSIIRFYFRSAMFETLPRCLRTSWRRTYFWKYLAEMRLKRFCRARCYATGTLSADEAQTMIVECQDQAGWYPLMILTVEDTLERAREMFADHPELPRLIGEGCEKVGRKWENYGDEAEHAIRWAIDNAEEYAANEGVILVRIAGENSEDAGNEGEE